MYRTHIIFLHSKLELVKCELLQLDSLQNSNWLIFKIYLKSPKSLPCYFFHINCTQELKVGPVGLDRSFYKLSNNIKFAKFGQAKQILFNFKVGVSIEIDLN